MALITELASLRKAEDALALGDMAWAETADGALGYTRSYGKETISVFINFSEASAAVPAEGRILLARNFAAGKLKPHGFVICKQEV